MAVLRFAKNTKGRDLAVGDIHGCVTKLLAAVDAIGFDPAVDRLFSVGDLVDRGPESDRFEELLSLPWFHAVQGNHEDMAIRWPNGHMDFGNYCANGGLWNATSMPDQCRIRADILAALPVAIEVETEAGLVGIVHADVPGADWPSFVASLAVVSSNRFVKSLKESAMWDRTRIESGDETPVAGVRAVIVGHTPLPAPVVLGNVHHIDTMGWRPHGAFTFINLADLSMVCVGEAAEA